MRTRMLALAAFFGLFLLSPTPSHAGHHLWTQKQVFSNASGSVQYVNLFCPADGEANLGAFSIVSGGHTFSFGTGLPTTHGTANTWVLVATTGFAGLSGGIAPDYTLPGGFLATGGGTTAYAGLDTWNYGTIPTDGVHALARDGSTPVNSPINFAGETGSVNLAAAAPAPALTGWAIAGLTGALLLVASGLLRRRQTPTV